MNHFKWRAVIFCAVAVPLVIGAVFVLTGGASFNAKPLSVLGEVPPFKLTERSGKTLDRDDLKGKVWIANFVFTSCSEQCPRLTAEMTKIQKRFRHRDNVRLVTFTVDPERDNPQALAEYANKVHADPEKWLFLTGARKELESLIQGGFHLAAGDPADTPSSMTHSMRLVLVDGSSQIRGYYDGMDSAAVKDLLSDTKRLLR